MAAAASAAADELADGTLEGAANKEVTPEIQDAIDWHLGVGVELAAEEVVAE